MRPYVVTINKLMKTQQDDRALVAAARQGDKQAFGLLIERHMGLAVRVAQRMLGEREGAQDLAQEAFLQAYLSLDQLQQPDHFANWLYGIVLNVCRSARRSRRLNYLSWEALTGGLHFDSLTFASPEPGPEEIVEANELIACVRAAVDGLSPANRQATLLFYFEGCSIREIAAQLGISVVAVKGRLHKARLQLHGALQTTYLPAMSQTQSASVNPAKELIMIKVTVTDVVQEENGNHVVVLLDESANRILPIWIGPFEGAAIAMMLLQRQTPRPLTYQFLANILTATDIHLTEVSVSALQGNTYYATIHLRSGQETYTIDARPSDAIALALQMNASLYVANDVMERVAAPIPAQFHGQPIRKGLDTVLQRWEEQIAAAQQQTAPASEQTKSDAKTGQQQLLDYLFSEAKPAAD